MTSPQPHHQSGTSWEDRYAGRPPWDIGRPQPAFSTLAAAGAIQGRVLDTGCGTGEHTLMAAGLGLDATGIDIVPNALDAARAKASDRNLAARFLLHDARNLADLGEKFDTVLDCGLFHFFHGDDLTAYVNGLRDVTQPGGRYFMLGFPERQPDGQQRPLRMSRRDIEAVFTDGWRIDSIEPVTLDTNIHPDGVRVRLLAATRI